MKLIRSMFGLALCAVLFVPRAPTAFTLDSTASTYPFVTRLVGSFELRGDSLIIDVSSGVVRSEIPGRLGEDGAGRDVKIAFGVGSQDSDSWSFDHATVGQLVTPSLEPGAASKIGALHFVITGLDTVPVAERWLAVELQVQQHLPGVQAGQLNSYACAVDNLQGATPQSRERAQRMRRNYSHNC